jgi:drug/metabolite transporter (DMT)-like permease
VQDQSSRRAIYAIIISMAAYVAGDVVLKLLGQSFPPSELIFFRSCIIAVALGAVLAWIKPRFISRALLSPPVIGRCLFDCVNILSFTTAVIHMNLAELYAILQMSPFLMTILAVIFFREPVGWRRWSAVAVGFCGVLLIIKPDPDNINTWAVLGVLAALGAACRETITRKIDPSVSTLEVTLLSAVFTAIGTFIFGFYDPWPAMSHRDIMLLFIQAASWVVGTFLLVHACRIAPLSLVATFRYSLLVWGALAGYFVFGDLPDTLAICGAVIIVLSGLYLFHREAVRRRVVASTVTGVS